MLIVLGGLLGSGRRVLADALALRYGLYHYDVDRKKFHQWSHEGTDRSKVEQPRTDAERIELYGRVLKEFPMLSKLHATVLLDDAFHREAPREYFLAEAKKYFERVVFVWVDSDDASAHERLRRAQQLGLVRSIGGAQRLRARSIAEFQPPPPSVPRFHYSISGTGQQKALWELVQTLSR